MKARTNYSILLASVIGVISAGAVLAQEADSTVLSSLLVPAVVEDTQGQVVSDETTASIRPRKTARKTTRAKPDTSRSASPLAGAPGASKTSAAQSGEAGDSGGGGGGASNTANDPTTPQWTFENDNYPWFSKYSHKSSGYEGDIRIVAPWKVGDQGWLTRVNIPALWTGRAYKDGGRIGGANDIAMYNWAISKIKVFEQNVTFGIGPLLTFPVGKVGSISQGKWQAGATAVFVATPEWGTLGAMFQWQRSYAGSRDVKGVNGFALQPFIYYNLADQYYLRSTGIMAYDTIRKTAVLPIGLGIGKVVKWEDKTINFWIEPQYSVARRGQGQTRFQIYVGSKILIPGSVNSLFAPKS